MSPLRRSEIKIKGFTKTGLFIFGSVAFAFVLVFLSNNFLSNVFATKYTSNDYLLRNEIDGLAAGNITEDELTPVYLPTPDSVKAIYMTQCVVGTPSFRDELVEIMEETEVNSVVIDVKDFSGGIGFDTDNPKLKDYISERCGASDMKEFIYKLKQKDIYTIARITVFQDPLYAKDHPEITVQKASDRSTWKDYKGLNFIDVGAKSYWEYIVELARETHDLGFDEINFDYIRYPSDGNMKDIYYPESNSLIVENPENGKVLSLEKFFKYLDQELRSDGIVISADLFGMTMTNTDDLNIGQVLEYTAPYFDYIAPMVYPSHYPKTFNGWDNPNKYPYEIIKFSMDEGVRRLNALATATSTPDEIKRKVSKDQLRPWIQDFDYGGDYGPEEVRAQIKATYDADLDSWMIWSPSNQYTIEALNNE